ncbi:MAG TPA: hypothetical protein DCX07_01045 [Phycisphaerales bacterium]|nr:hypothetical protein [Phycisphaerales bacterium]
MLKNPQNLTIVLLLATAVVLAAMLLATFTTRDAQAGTSAGKQGDYIMVNGMWSGSTDLVYIVDIAARKLNVYYAHAASNDVKLIQTVDLAKAFEE